MQITVKQLSEHSGVSKRTILHYLLEKKYPKLVALGVKDFKLVGSQYVLIMDKDFNLNDNE